MKQAIRPDQHEERRAILNAGFEKLLNDDLDGAIKALAKTQVTAETLAMFKETRGADWIREQGFDTTRADERYGAGWLDT